MRLFGQEAFTIKSKDDKPAKLTVGIGKLIITKENIRDEFYFTDYITFKDLVDAINSNTDLNMEATISTGATEEPISNEQHIVHSEPPYQVQLNHIPKRGTLYLTSFQEVTFNPGPGQFRCDYETGMLTFNAQNSGTLFQANYTALRPANIENLETKYLEIANNEQKTIKTDPVPITYHNMPTSVPDVIEHLLGIPIETVNARITAKWIESNIKRNLSHIENKLRIFLTEKIIKCQSTPYGFNVQPGVNCDFTEPPYDGTDTNYLKLRYEPLLSVQRVELVYLGQLVRSYPFEWIQTNPFRSELRIVPKTGAFHLMGMYSGSYLFHSFFPRSTSMFGHFLPWIQVDYTAGHRPGKCPSDLTHALELYVVIDVLRVADGLFNPAMSSKSIDGVSESMTRSSVNSLYGGRIKEYNEEIQALLKPWTRMRMQIA